MDEVCTTGNCWCCIVGAAKLSGAQLNGHVEDAKPMKHRTRWRCRGGLPMNHHVTVRYWKFCNTSPSDFGVCWIPHQYLKLSVALVMSGKFWLRWHNRCWHFWLCQRNRNYENWYICSSFQMEVVHQIEHKCCVMMNPLAIHWLWAGKSKDPWSLFTRTFTDVIVMGNLMR